MNKILIEIILTNQCNKRCEYCDLDFHSTIISLEYIDTLYNIMKKSTNCIFHINFFGGEPLLCFDILSYSVNKFSELGVTFSLGTNGELLNKEMCELFLKNDFQVYLSIDNITGIPKHLDINEKYLEIFKINFIQDPDFLFQSKKVFQDIQNYGFTSINYMPVYTTKNWDTNQIIELGKIYKYIKNITDIIVSPFTYFSGFSSDKQFILETDGYVYQDVDSLLWLQKQYSNVSPELKCEINKKMVLTHVDDITIFDELLKSYNEDSIRSLVLKIPKTLGQTKTNSLISSIFEHVK